MAKVAKKSTKATPKRKCAHITEKEASLVKNKVRSAIAATTRLMEKLEKSGAPKNEVPYISIKRFRKRLMDANNFFGWRVEVYAWEAPRHKIATK